MNWQKLLAIAIAVAILIEAPAAAGHFVATLYSQGLVFLHAVFNGSSSTG